MLTIKKTSQFKKDYKNYSNDQNIENDLRPILEALVNEKSLDQKYKDHPLKGNYKDYRECHIRPDLLLIYKIDNEYLQLARIGKHSNLF